MYHHRGAYLQALAMVGHTGLDPDVGATCGRCRCSTATAGASRGRSPPPAATHVCLPRVDPAEVWRLIGESGSPTCAGRRRCCRACLRTRGRRRWRHRCGWRPAARRRRPALLRRMAELGFDVTHLYGLTETYGPAVICDWRPEWGGLDADEQARLKARQGVGNMIACRPGWSTSDGDRRARRRRDGRRDRAARQQRDARLPQRRRGDRGSACPTAGSAPATSA